MRTHMCVQLLEHGTQCDWDWCSGLKDAMDSMKAYLESNGCKNIAINHGLIEDTFHVHFDGNDPFSGRIHAHFKVVKEE